jgi:hypothetical protein
MFDWNLWKAFIGYALFSGDIVRQNFLIWLLETIGEGRIINIVNWYLGNGKYTTIDIFYDFLWYLKYDWTTIFSVSFMYFIYVFRTSEFFRPILQMLVYDFFKYLLPKLYRSLKKGLYKIIILFKFLIILFWQKIILNIFTPIRLIVKLFKLNFKYIYNFFIQNSNDDISFFLYLYNKHIKIWFIRKSDFENRDVQPCSC